MAKRGTLSTAAGLFNAASILASENVLQICERAQWTNCTRQSYVLSGKCSATQDQQHLSSRIEVIPSGPSRCHLSHTSELLLSYCKATSYATSRSRLSEGLHACQIVVASKPDEHAIRSLPFTVRRHAELLRSRSPIMNIIGGDVVFAGSIYPLLAGSHQRVLSCRFIRASKMLSHHQFYGMIANKKIEPASVSVVSRLSCQWSPD